MVELVSIASEGLGADIHFLGAQLFALRDGEGRDLLWNGDPAFWTGRAPILFPIVGELAGGVYRLDGKSYALPRHGFARTRSFTLVEQTPASVRFRLTWDEETFQVYPFAFQLDLRFSVAGRALTLAAEIGNHGLTPMPASFGFHPALRWPLPFRQPRAEHRLLFEKNEPAPVRRLDAKGLVLPGDFPTPVVGRELVLRDDLFGNDAIIFDALASRSLSYGTGAGPQLNITFPDTPMLGVWTKPGAPFICIEPWHGIADAEGFAGDFRDKKGIFLVPPGGTHICAMRIGLDAK